MSGLLRKMQRRIKRSSGFSRTHTPINQFCGTGGTDFIDFFQKEAARRKASLEKDLIFSDEVLRLQSSSFPDVERRLRRYVKEHPEVLISVPAAPAKET